MSRPKGSLNKSTLAKLAALGQLPPGKTAPVTKPPIGQDKDSTDIVLNKYVDKPKYIPTVAPIIHNSLYPDAGDKIRIVKDTTNGLKMGQEGVVKSLIGGIMTIPVGYEVCVDGMDYMMFRSECEKIKEEIVKDDTINGIDTPPKG